MFIPSKADLPLLIHGKEGVGASAFSIKLVAGFAKKDNAVVFWSAHSAAKDTLKEEFGGILPRNITVIENENPAEIDSILAKVDSSQTLFVKNFEALPEKVKEGLLQKKLLIISGDLEKVLTKEEVLEFPTRIFFSPYVGIEVPVLEKYQGYLFSNGKNEKVKN